MKVISSCPLRVQSVVWQAASGVSVVTVAAKATFELRPAESPLAGEQDEPNPADGYWNDDERRSLHVAGDLAPLKARADVILVGSAFAPRGQPVRSLVARMVIGDVDKSIEVFADRAFALDGSLHEGQGFTKMPLTWERAAGGPHTPNPVGVRADAPPDTRGWTPLPNLQPAGIHVMSRKDFIAPVGYGPISPWWPGRQAKLHRGLAGWDFRQWFHYPLPADLDGGFFNAAPPDQQTDVIRPNERIVLENLLRDQPRLVTSLAPVTPRVRIERAAGAAQELEMRCDTLSIDTDRGTCSLTWRRQLLLEQQEVVKQVVVLAGSGAAPAAPADAPARRRFTKTLGIDAPPPASELPFVQSAPPPADTSSSVTDTLLPGVAIAPELPFVKEGASWRGTTRTAMEDPSKSALPFRAGRHPLSATQIDAPEPVPQPVAPPRVWGADDETTQPVVAATLRTASATPWSRSHVEEPPPVPTPLDVGAPDPQDVPASPAPPEPARPAPVQMLELPLPFDPVRSSPAAAFEPLALMPVAAPVPEAPPAPAPLLAGLAPPPETPAAELQRSPDAAATGDEGRPPGPLGPPTLPLDAFPLERCAAIAASIARVKPDRDRILREQELDPEVWDALDRHHLEQVRAQAGRGRTAPLKAYDAAYVARLEEERGPIRVDEYARLLVAQERGEAEDVLGALGLPRGALLRIQRVWLGRVAADAELGKSVRAATDAAREA